MQSIGVLIKERRPVAAYGHLLPQGEKGNEEEPDDDYAASMRLKPFHMAVAAPEVSTGRMRVSW